ASSAAPMFNSPICAGATSVSGTSSEANGTTIEVFVNSVSAGTTTVSSNAWTKSGLSGLSAADAVTAKATTTGKCTSAASASVTVSANPPSPTITPSSGSVCANSTDNQASGPAATSYSWTVTNGTITNGANSQTVTYTAGASGSVTLNLTVTNASGCSVSNSTTVSITQPPTTATVGPNQTIPPGGTTAPLGGNTPTSGTGKWTIATTGFTGTFNPNDTTPNATWTNTGATGSVKLRWTISNPPCPDSFAEVTIQIGVAPTISCPNPIVVNPAQGQCSASVSFNVGSTGTPAPTVVCKVGNTVITSPATFNVGTTTVNCTASNGVQPDANCSFTVTVVDNQPPVFPNGCPADIAASAAASCTFATGRAVTFATPT